MTVVIVLVSGCGAPAGVAAGSSDGSSETTSPGEAGTPPATTSTMEEGGPSATTAPPAEDDDGADEDGADSSDTTAGDPSVPSCAPDAAVAGQYDAIAIEHDGLMRSYNLYVPEGVDGTEPLPLVLNFHGLGSDAGQQQLFSLMNPTADEHGLVVAYPNGVASSWNAGTCCGQASSDAVDDVGFALAVIDDVATRACIDPKRVYATGMSNGGFMSHRLACEAADRIAAIAPVAGVIGVPLEECAPSRPVPVLQLHGTLDILVPYGGNGVWPGAVETVAHWSTKNGCAGEPVETFAMGDVRCEATESCDGGAHTELCTIMGGGHCWPGDPICPLGLSTLTISASDRMAEFFLGFALP